MKTSRTFLVPRWIVIFLVAVGWLVLSNHCALGLRTLTAQSVQAHSCCHSGAPNPEQHLPGSENGLTCCKALHGLPGDGSAAFEAKRIPFFYFSFHWEAARGTKVSVPLRQRPADTGPPRAASFSELTLHRSLRSHAPPFLA